MNGDWKMESYISGRVCGVRDKQRQTGQRDDKRVGNRNENRNESRELTQGRKAVILLVGRQMTYEMTRRTTVLYRVMRERDERRRERKRRVLKGAGREVERVELELGF